MEGNASHSNPCKYTDFYECHLAVFLWKIFAPLLIVFGLVGNTLSVVVWSRRRMCTTTCTTSLYLRVLAVVDTSVLLIATLRELIFYSSNIDIQVLNDFSCRVHTWLAFSVTALPAWLLSALAIDRLASVKFPMWAKLHCSKRNAAIISAVLTVSVFLINSHELMYLNRAGIYFRSELTNKTILIDVSCEPVHGQYDFIWHKLWPVVVLILYSIGPTVCLITCSAIMLRTLQIRNSGNRSSKNTNCQDKSNPTAHKRNYKPLTKMLIAVCFFFVACSLPICIFLILEPFCFNSNTPRGLASRRLGWAIVALILYFNNAFNFVLYCLSSVSFRGELSIVLLNFRNMMLRRVNTRVVPQKSSDMP